jgi:DNA (cytosine-5)-methyltransferase 1
LEGIVIHPGTIATVLHSFHCQTTGQRGAVEGQRVRVMRVFTVNSGRPLTFGSLFAGIGGFDLGFERAGMQCRWQVEIDDYANQVLEKHWPDVARYRDIRECGAHNLEAVDVICGGFPCQDISNAGKRAGIDGERSGLWSEFHRIICEIRPRYVVVENVAALLVRGIDRVLGDLASIGFDAEWDVLPAAAFGAHFDRERVFIVASSSVPNCLRFQGEWTASPGTWSEQQFEGLVEHELSVCVPAGKTRRVSDGISNRVGRLRGLGNAVVPQVAEWIGRRIVEASKHSGRRAAIEDAETSEVLHVQVPVEWLEVTSE